MPTDGPGSGSPCAVCRGQLGDLEFLLGRSRYRLYGTFTLLAPVALVSCYVIALGWSAGMTFGRAIGSSVRIGVALPIPLALANGLFFLIAWMFPANRAAVENYDGNHYYVSDVGEHLLLTTIGMVVVSASVALLVLILLTLPLLVVRTPAAVADETRLRRVRSVRARKVSISLIVCSLSVFLLGGILLAATRGTDWPQRAVRTIPPASSGPSGRRSKQVEPRPTSWSGSWGPSSRPWGPRRSRAGWPCSSSPSWSAHHRVSSPARPRAVR